MTPVKGSTEESIPEGASGSSDCAVASGQSRAFVDAERALRSPDKGNAGADSCAAIRCGNGRLVMQADGLYFLEEKDSTTERVRICSPFAVVAHTEDGSGRAWGKLLRWRDRKGRAHQWAMPLALLQTDSTAELRRELADGGLFIAQGRANRERFATYLALANPAQYARCVDRLGWHGEAFLLPDGVVGESAELIVYQTESSIKPPLRSSGSAEDWRATVANLARGNARVMFAISTAFAGALLESAGVHGGGFHLVGSSSTGKTTALLAACSVWGNPAEYLLTWRATDNGLESRAALHNDGFLCLDEISEASPDTIRETIYMLANGHGKARADQSGRASRIMKWRLLFLSCGETSLQTVVAGAGRRANAGDEVRLAEIPADAEFGVFDTLNSSANGGELANAIRDAAMRYYGAVGRAWIAYLVRNKPQIDARWKIDLPQEVKRLANGHQAGQILRVAERFALVGCAGELAQFLTGWETGEAAQAAEICFHLWRESFGDGNREAAELLAQVRHFLDMHGASRFAPPKQTEEELRIANHAGFYEHDDSGRKLFWIFPEVFKREICGGFEPRQATTILRKAGWLRCDNERATQQKWLPGLGNRRVYVVGITG